MELHPVQEKIYQIYKEAGKLLPYRELAKILGVSSLNTVSYHINQLKKKGYFAVEKESKGVVPLNIKNLLNFESKKGLYVLLKNNKPFYVKETEDIKKSLLEKIVDNGSPVFLKIKAEANPENISIAYYLIDDPQKRKDLEQYLKKYYSDQG